MKKLISKKIIQPVTELAESGKLSGILLLICTVISLILSNFLLGERYVYFWQNKIGIELFSKTIEHWINDGLMAVFFLLVGLEIKRELISGELSNIKSSILPVIAALGGVMMPSLIYIFFTSGTAYMDGWAIPSATDIAFSLGILTILGDRVPASLKIILTALAIIDDLAAIIIIAVFYTASLNFIYLLSALITTAVLIALNRLKVDMLVFYFIAGILLWFFILKSGVHATIAGVILAFTIPFHSIEKLEHNLIKPVNYFILPLFALVSTAIPMNKESLDFIFTPLGPAVVLGLLIGKPAGITLFTYLSSKLNIVSISKELKFRHILGLSFIAGIGFTMSIFITNLSFEENEIVNKGKLAVLTGSLLSAVSGILILRSDKSNQKITQTFES